MYRYVEIDDIHGFGFFCTVRQRFIELDGQQCWDNDIHLRQHVSDPKLRLRLTELLPVAKRLLPKRSGAAR